jgi:membrane fusion protein, macrolide-specific efflux system
MTALLRRCAAHPWITAAVVAVLLAGGVSGFWLSRSSAKPVTVDPYRLVAAQLGTIRQAIASTGTISPAVQDALNFGVSGRVTSVRVTAGQKVTAGQVLATIDSSTLQANLAQAKATLASDQAKVASDTAAAASSTQIAAENAAVTAAQAAVNSAQSALNDATMTAPITGVAASMNLVVGQQVSGSSAGGSSGGSGASGSGGSGSGGTGGGGSGGSGTGGGTTGTGSGSTSGSGSSSSTTAQILVISTTSWQCTASVDDTEVGLLANGDQAQILPDGASATVYGTVASVGLIGTSTSGVATYPVVVNVTGNPAGLLDGETATVSLIYRQLSNVLTVPTVAVHTSGTTRFVYELANGKQVKHTVVTGAASGGQTQITSGLKEGEQVVAPASRTGTTRTGGGGGFGGGGFGGGGFGGGGGGLGGGGARTGGGG